MEADDDLEGECPNCGEDVAYDDWGCAGGSGFLVCPCCMHTCEVDDVYPEG